MTSEAAHTMLCRNMRELRELICMSRLDYHESDNSDICSDDSSDVAARSDVVCQLSRLSVADECHSATPDSGLVRHSGSMSDSDGFASDRPCQRSVSGVPQSSRARPHRFTTADFAELFDCIQEKKVARWLDDANAVIAQLVDWSTSPDNFVNFAHFWLSEFAASDRDALIRMECDIFIERLSSAFPPSVKLSQVMGVAAAVLHEYPRRLLSIEGPRFVLSWLDVLTSSKRSDEFRRTFSSIHCSTTCHKHSEIVLSLRAFALVSIVSAFVMFHEKLLDSQLYTAPDEVTPLSARDDVSHSGIHPSVPEQRIFIAIRKSYVDVVHFLIKSGRVSADFVDSHGRSLLFLAVLHRSRLVVQFLLTHVLCRDVVDVNRAADNGNTALHVATSFGDTELVDVLLSAGANHINVDSANVDVGGATPLHLAVMHGHEAIVCKLLDAGADRTLTVDGQTVVQIAETCGQSTLVQLLTS